MIVLNPTQLISIPLEYVDPATKESYDMIGCWKVLSWSEHNKVYSRSIQGDNLDSILYRDGKLKTCLKKLIINKENVDLDDDVIDNLPARLASNLIGSFEKYFEPSEDDLKQLESVSYAFFKGQHVSGVMPQYLYEHLLANHYSWSLPEIRSMSNYDFQVHLRVCLVRERIENEFRVTLAGGKSGGKTSGSGKYGRETVHKKFDPVKGDFV